MIDRLRILGEYLRTSVASPATTTLNGAITAATLSITLTSGAAFSGYDLPLVLKIDSEYVIGARSGNTFTVDLGCRGALGSTAASHSDGATVSLANLYMVAGSALWPDKLPIGFNCTPAILYSVRGGPGADPLVPASDLSVQFFTYGPTYDDAIALDRLLFDRLHGVTTTNTASGCILHAHQEVEPQNATEPDTEWPRVFTAYRIGVRSI